jgi:hypothetical protein
MANIADAKLSNIVLFYLKCSLFHGNRKLSASDLHDAMGVTIDVKGSNNVMALGVKRVFDKTELAKITAIKRAMLTACALVGTPFMNGFAVPSNKADALWAELETLVARGEGLKVSLLARYQTILEGYATSNPKWTGIIQECAFSQGYVEDQIQFDFGAMRLAPADEDGPMAQGLSTKVGGILGSLLLDISKAANYLGDNSLNGKSGVTRRAFRPLLGMADKLDGFTFVDTRVGNLADMIRHVLSTMPDEGRIEGADLRNLVGLTSILSNPDRALVVGQQVADNGVNDAFDLLFGTPPSVALPPAAVVPLGMTTDFATPPQPVVLAEVVDTEVMPTPAMVRPAYVPPVDTNIFGI